MWAVKTPAVLSPRRTRTLLGLSVGRDRVEAEPAAAADVVRCAGRFPLAIRLAGARLAHRSRLAVGRMAEQMARDPLVLHHLAQEESTVTGAFAASYRAAPGFDQACLPIPGPVSR